MYCWDGVGRAEISPVEFQINKHKLVLLTIITYTDICQQKFVDLRNIIVIPIWKNTSKGQASEFIEGTGICEGLAGYAADVENQAKQTGSSPDPLKVYKGISSINGHPPPLFKLANHILSICPNSASCERLFSVFGNTLTKLRNRLENTTLTSLAELKMHIRDEHVRDADTKKRMKRFFGAAPDVSPPQAGVAPEPALQVQALVSPSPTAFVSSALAAIISSAPTAIVSPAPNATISQFPAPAAIFPQSHDAPHVVPLLQKPRAPS
jgi:hypothetical protein